MVRPLPLLALWLLVLAGVALLAAARLEPGGDLRLFMPQPQTADERLLLDTLGDGPGSRVLLLALGGDDPDLLAEQSLALREQLADAPGIRRIANGDDQAETIDEALLPARYLLSPTLDEARFDAAFLRAALQQRLQDLGSPAAALVEPWVPRDPTLEVLRLAEAWRPAIEPERHDGVWLAADRRHALLLVETAHGGFDPPAQQATLAAIHAAAATLDGTPPTLEVSGPAAFSVLLQQRTRGEATRLGIAASLGILLLLALAYRSLRWPLLGALPLASAALAGLLLVALLFDRVHGITLAFGFTLLGLAQDYPVHLFSHLRPRTAHPGPGPGSGPPRAPAAADHGDADAVMRTLWPTLATGVGSTCLAYASFAVAGVTGLLQLAVFTIAGLLVAAASTRWLLPALVPPPRHDVADRPRLRALAARLRPLQRLRPWLLVAGALAALSLLLSPRAPWDDSLASLTPVPAELLARDRALRSELGAPDVRYLLVVEAGDQETLLQRSEALDAPLQALVARGALDGFDPPHRYLPSARTQRQRQARLPAPAELAAALAEASAGLPFRRDLFVPFLADVEAARNAAPLDRAALAGTALASRLDALLPPGSAQPTALIGLTGVADVDALATLAAAQAGAHLLDLRAASESLAARYRGRVLWALAAALLVLAFALPLALRSIGRAARVLAPMLLASLLAVALLHGAGVGFTLFHLVSLILAAGLGLDYALFFERAGHDGAEQRRTLHAVLVCVASTSLVFGLLATSQIPVLRAIGISVTTGVVLQFACALLLAARSRADDRP